MRKGRCVVAALVGCIFSSLLFIAVYLDPLGKRAMRQVADDFIATAELNSARRMVRSAHVPQILDLVTVTHGLCMSQALGRTGVRQTNSFLSLPFASWNQLFCEGRNDCSLCGVPCLSVPPISAFPCAIEVLSVQPPREVTCGDNTCAVSTSLHSTGADFDAVILYAPFLSNSVFESQAALDRILWPRERSRDQIWALTAMWESYSYYPAGADPRVLNAMNLTIGSDRKHLDKFIASYLPDWDAMLRPFSLADKLARAAVERRSNVTLIQSNCESKSGRETFLSELLQLMPVDSFGACLNTRDPTLAFNAQNFWAALESKHMLLYGYKFALTFENSYLHDYVTEKVFDAWESHVVPIYRGAPNIHDYAPGPHSFIHVTDDMSPAALMSLLVYLERNETAYLEYHAWRSAPRETILKLSPLAGTLRSQTGSSPVCVVCDALSDARLDFRQHNEHVAK